MSGRSSAQTREEREELLDIFMSDPRVIVYKAALLTYAERNNLTYSVDGFNSLCDFSNAWIAKHYPLPDSGIVSD